MPHVELLSAVLYNSDPVGIVADVGMHAGVHRARVTDDIDGFAAVVPP